MKLNFLQKLEVILQMEVNSIQELELILRMGVDESRIVEKSKKRHSVSLRKPKQGETNPNQFAVSTAPFTEIFNKTAVPKKDKAIFRNLTKLININRIVDLDG